MPFLHHLTLEHEPMGRPSIFSYLGARVGCHLSVVRIVFMDVWNPLLFSKSDDNNDNDDDSITETAAASAATTRTRKRRRTTTTCASS